MLKALKGQQRPFSAMAGTMVRERKLKEKGTERDTMVKDQVRRWSAWNCSPVNWLIPVSQ